MTLRGRVTLAAGLAVAAAIAVASLAAWLVVRTELRREIDDNLSGQLSVLQARSGPPLPGLGVEPPVGPTSTDTADLFVDSYVQIVSSDGSVEASFGDRRLTVIDRTVTTAEGTEGPWFSDVEVDGESVRVLTGGISDGRAVQLGRSLEDVEDTLARLGAALVVVSLAGVLLAALLGRVTAAAATAPVQRLSAAAQTIARTGDPSHPIDVHGDDELGRLAQAFNAMLEALGTSLRRQRALVADASHELRTPVASIRTNAEILERSPDLDPTERAEVLRAVVSQTEEMSSLIDDLLEIARHEDAADPFEAFLLRDEVDRAVRQAALTHPDLAIEMQLDEGATMVGARSRVRRAVVNLLDNAAKWSPPGGVVHVTQLGTAVVVRDEGPGFDPGDLEWVFDRFYRSAAARGRPGSGLGLAIVRQVAEEHGGRVVAGNAADGGAVVRLEFPPGVLTGSSSESS